MPSTEGEIVRQLKMTSVTGLFLEIHIDTEHGSDEEALGHLEYTGRRGLYVVKRQTS